jgi:hypothetical protein
MDVRKHEQRFNVWKGRFVGRWIKKHVLVGHNIMNGKSGNTFVESH